MSLLELFDTPNAPPVTHLSVERSVEHFKAYPLTDPSLDT